MSFVFSQTCHSRLQAIASWGPWCSGRILGTQRESSGFESDPSHYVDTLGKLFTHDWLRTYDDSSISHFVNDLLCINDNVIIIIK